MTDVYIVTTGSQIEARTIIDMPTPPKVLVSYCYLRNFDTARERNEMKYEHWVMDSGGFTAWKSGAEIDLKTFTRHSKRRLADDPTLRFVFQLDKIGDWRMTQNYAQYQWDAGVPVIPIFHLGSPIKALEWFLDRWPGRIALSGTLRAPELVRETMRTLWPREVHALGVMKEQALMTYPYASCDASSWISPARFGRWKAFGGQNLSIRMKGKKASITMRAEVELNLQIESALKRKWAAQLQEAANATTNAWTT